MGSHTTALASNDDRMEVGPTNNTTHLISDHTNTWSEVGHVSNITHPCQARWTVEQALDEHKTLRGQFCPHNIVWGERQICRGWYCPPQHSVTTTSAKTASRTITSG